MCSLRLQIGTQCRLVQMPVADFVFAVQQHRHQLVVFGFQIGKIVDFDNLQFRAVFRQIRLHNPQ